MKFTSLSALEIWYWQIQSSHFNGVNYFFSTVLKIFIWQLTHEGDVCGVHFNSKTGQGVFHVQCATLFDYELEFIQKLNAPDEIESFQCTSVWTIVFIKKEQKVFLTEKILYGPQFLLRKNKKYF